jgi:hypothetical protein
VIRKSPSSTSTSFIIPNTYLSGGPKSAWLTLLFSLYALHPQTYSSRNNKHTFLAEIRVNYIFMILLCDLDHIIEVPVKYVVKERETRLIYFFYNDRCLHSIPVFQLTLSTLHFDFSNGMNSR